MTTKKLYMGAVLVTFLDLTTARIQIFKNGSTIYIDNNIVHPSNNRTIEGIIHEISVIRNKGIQKWEWVEFGKDHHKLKF